MIVAERRRDPAADRGDRRSLQRARHRHGQARAGPPRPARRARRRQPAARGRRSTRARRNIDELTDLTRELTDHVAGPRGRRPGTRDEAPRSRRRRPGRRARRLVCARAVAIDERRDPLVDRPLVEQPSDARGPAAGDGRASSTTPDHETASGQPIEIVVVSCDSSVQADDLVSRVNGCGRPTTAAKDEGEARRRSDDRDAAVGRLARRHQPPSRARRRRPRTPPTASPRPGSASSPTARWPSASDGRTRRSATPTSSTLARRSRRAGTRTRTAREPTWGRRPLLAFTNPNTSTSGRNVLVSLYSMAARTSRPAELTVADIERPEVVELRKEFQAARRPLHAGHDPAEHEDRPGDAYGHFFLMPEDNLVSLYKGNEKAIAADGTEQPVEPVKDLVMIYPKEGSVLNSNPAGDRRRAAGSPVSRRDAARGVDRLPPRGRRSNAAFMDAGFRPAAGTGLAVDERAVRAVGTRADQPPATHRTGRARPGCPRPDHRLVGRRQEAGDRHVRRRRRPVRWRASRSTRCKDGLTARPRRDGGTPPTSSADNQVGLVTFSNTVETEIAPSPVQAVEVRHRRRDQRDGGGRGDRALRRRGTRHPAHRRCRRRPARHPCGRRAERRRGDQRVSASTTSSP